jgi:hypothetical protein
MGRAAEPSREAARDKLLQWKARPAEATLEEIAQVLHSLEYMSSEEDDFVIFLGEGPCWTFPALAGNIPAKQVYNFAHLMLNYLSEQEDL